MANGEDPEESDQNSQAKSRGLKTHLDTLTEHRDRPRVRWGKQRPCLGRGGVWRVTGSCLVPLVFSRNILLHTPCIFS